MTVRKCGIVVVMGGSEDGSKEDGSKEDGSKIRSEADDGEMIGLPKRPASDLVGMREHLPSVLAPSIVSDPVAMEKIWKDPAYINPEGQRSPVELWIIYSRYCRNQRTRERCSCCVFVKNIFKQVCQCRHNVRYSCKSSHKSQSHNKNII